MVFSLTPVFAQQTDSSGNNGGNKNNYSPDSIFVINSFNFNVDGRTRPYALINKADLIIGEEIIGFANLEKYIQNKTQLLINERVLKNNVLIEYTVDEPPENEDGEKKFPVNLTITVEDTWNIVGLPYPKYDSNTGFEIIIKLRDYNFLGTMSPLRLDVGYRNDEEKRHIFTSMLDADIPFRFLGLNWNFDFDNNFNYQPNKEFHYYFVNKTGLYVDIPVGFTTMTIGFYEHLIYNEENSNHDKILFGKNFQEGLYMSSRPYISWKIPTRFMFGDEELTYTPRISAVFNHEISAWALSENRIGPFFTFSHDFSVGRVDWIGNFKKGFSASISNSVNYNFYYLQNNSYFTLTEQDPLTSSLDVSGAGYFILTDFLGFSTRFKYRHWFNTYNSGAGDTLRGFRDGNISADYMVSVNFDVPIRVLRFKPSKWFNSKVKVFDFDLHLSPVVDFAVYQEHKKDGAGYFLLSAGLEAIIFPDFFRSLFLRVSFGYGLLGPDHVKGYELFVGMELHY